MNASATNTDTNIDTTDTNNNTSTINSDNEKLSNNIYLNYLTQQNPNKQLKNTSNTPTTKTPANNTTTTSNNTDTNDDENIQEDPKDFPWYHTCNIKFLPEPCIVDISSSNSSCDVDNNNNNNSNNRGNCNNTSNSNTNTNPSSIINSCYLISQTSFNFGDSDFQYNFHINHI